MKGYGIERNGEHIKFCETQEQAYEVKANLLANEAALIEAGWIDQAAEYQIRRVDTRTWK